MGNIESQLPTIVTVAQAPLSKVSRLSGIKNESKLKIINKYIHKKQWEF